MPGPEALFGVVCDDVWDDPGGNRAGCLVGLLGGEGDFAADPGYCDATAGDFRRGADTSCLPGTLPGGYEHERVGAFAAGCAACDPVSIARKTGGDLRRRFR